MTYYAAVHQVSVSLVRDNKVYSQTELENLRQLYPKDEYKRRGRKPSRRSIQKTNTTPLVATHEPLKVMEDDVEGAVVRPPESAQSLIGRFFYLLKSGEIEHYLSEYTPAAQAHLIDEIRTGINLLEEFVAKNKTIEVTSAN